MIVIIQPNQAIDGRGHFLCIEMKKQKGGQLSAHQKEWIEAIISLSITEVVSAMCKGCEEAKTLVSQYLQSPIDTIF